MSRIADVLAALREERQNLLTEVSRIDRAIAALEDASDNAPAAAPAKAAAPTLTGVPRRTPGPYSMMTLYEAAAEYLAAAGVPQTTRQIADGLRTGGFRTMSSKFGSTVGTMLRRKASSSPYGIRQHSDGKRWYFKG